MEQYLDKIIWLVGILGLAAGFLYRHWTKFKVVYQCAKSAYWIVEEIAKEEGLVSEEKAELFEKKFRSLMKWGGRFITKDTMELAFNLAKKFCAKYRKTKKIDKKEHIIEEDVTIILVPKEA